MLDALATPVGYLLAYIHSALSTVFSPASGPAWGLSIVLLTCTVRLVLFPLFVKQIKSQRRMQELAPRIKELQKAHKGDRETLNTEMMKLYKENNANPISGCLPLLVQLPVFFALFRVIREFQPGREAKFGLSAQLLEEGGKAKIFGAPISAGFNSPADLLVRLDGNLTVVRVVCAIMVVLMGLTTFYTQRQMIARNTTTDPQQIMVQKLLLYVLPFSFCISGAFFPVGVLLYWLTTNIWSMGQQAYVIKRMPPVNLNPGAAGPKGSGPKSSVPKSSGPKGSGPQGSDPKNGKGGPSGNGNGNGNGAGNGNGNGGDGPVEDPQLRDGNVPASVGGRPSTVDGTVGVGEGRPVSRTAATVSQRRSSGSRKNKRKGGRR